MYRNIYIYIIIYKLDVLYCYIIYLIVIYIYYIYIYLEHIPVKVIIQPCSSHHQIQMKSPPASASSSTRQKLTTPLRSMALDDEIPGITGLV